MIRVHRVWVVAVLALCASTQAGEAQEADEQESGKRPERPQFEISRASSAVKIDGELDEPAWQDALRMTLDYEWFPADNQAPPVETEVLLTYDHDNLYIAFRAFDPDPSAIRAHLMDRDEIHTFVQDDHVLMMIDTFNDERRAFQFRVNPLGVQADAVFSELDGIEDFSWDAIWDSKGRITATGFEIEIALPMNQLRFPAGDEVQTWGFDFGRSYPRNDRHRIANTRRDRNVSCILCQAATVTGFETIKAGRNLVITPTVTVDRTDKRDELPDGQLASGDENVEPGITVRWGVTPNYTINATLNPDFSQVEADVAQLNVNQRFALFFPEQRPFFLEGVDFFSTLMPTVFTRTVANPDWGGKLTGKQGKNAIGVFATQDTINNIVIPSNQGSSFTSIDEEVLGSVLRYRRDVGKGSTLGVIYTGREGDEYHNRVAGVDGFLRFSDKDTLSFQYLRSSTLYPKEMAERFDQPDEEFDAGALEVLYSHQERGWDLLARYRDFEEGFRADFGFIPRVDMRRGALLANKKFWPGEESDTWWNRQAITFYGIRVEDQGGELTDELVLVGYNISGPMQSIAQVQIGTEKQLFDGVLYDGLVGGNVFFAIQPSGTARFSLFTQWEETIDFANNQPADAFFFKPSMELKLGDHINLQLTHTLQTLDVEGGELLQANLTEMRFVYQFNIRMFVRAILQYRDIARNPELYQREVEPNVEALFTQFLFSYKVNAQTVLFAGYSENRLGTLDFDLTQRDRTFFIKLGYAWVL